MKILSILSIILFVSFISCNNQPKKETTAISEDSTQLVENPATKTYAEISIKEGGHWEGKEYMEGTFKNVKSVKVPQEHTDHSWYIRYEGPGWESNKVGYRLYLDWRNAIDIFGKVTDDMVLSDVGQDGFDSYHEMNDWGMDILKAGKGLGIGSLGRYINKEVVHFQEVDSTFAKVENTLENSSVNINYYGWKTANDKIDLSSKLTIAPNQRITKHTIQSSSAIPNICTGIVKHGVDFFTKESENKKWGYIATYGVQTLVPDKLGMAIFYEVASVEKVTEWDHDHLLIFNPTTEKVSYYFLGAWEQEKGGIKTKQEFLSYLDEKLNDLNTNHKL